METKRSYRPWMAASLKAGVAFACLVALSAQSAQTTSPAQPAPAASEDSVASPAPAVSPSSRVGRYGTADGKQQFILDRSGEDAKVQFEGSSEVLVLKSQPAPMGERWLKLDTGDVLLRVTTWGGLTLFTPDNRHGIPVDRMGDAPPLSLPVYTLEDLHAHAVTIEAQIGMQLGRFTPLSVDWAALPDTAEARATLHDALDNVGAAIQRFVAEAVEPEDVIDGLRSVAILVGPRPGVAMDGGRFVVVIAPEEGLEGRFSSAALAAYLKSEL
ncbi:MAG: DUF4908 domain-containing protein [Alphaproteobacteria bacterium]|nr:DUF4908 domain-containing protein [Alphaproteobacteria bacterium]